MDLEYDMKFEEMKKYIPFLESMIQRLDSTSSASANPRQAQLDKIRSLRDLLLVKKKRMKMENLLKCEQVLINLYAKVEQRDTLPGIQPASKVINPKDKTDLNLARHKLKAVTTDPDTLPEIARASETEVVCVPGSKEPALFQRRPNKSSLSPPNASSNEKSPIKSSSKRNYTRVLLSPDRSTKHWSPSNGSASDKPLFSRRTPPRPSRKYSPSYHKREKKKSSKQESNSRKPKDLNITLKVPEESLDSLNTKDILSRIINCSDGDVDIATLRELRKQILGELKQTGANEDISDLILKSYKSKKRTNKKDDVEEGELSDSESEAIESIYGNLQVVVEKDSSKDASNQNKSLDHDEVPRKIQICLVINSDKEERAPESSRKKGTEKQKVCDITDFEMFDDNICNVSSQPPFSEKAVEFVDTETVSQNTKPNHPSPSKANHVQPQEIITVEDVDSGKEENKCDERGSGVIDMNNFDLQNDSNNFKSNEVSQSAPKSSAVPFKANFYKPLIDLAEVTDAVNTGKPQDKSGLEPASTTLSKTVDKSVTVDKSKDMIHEEPADKTKVDKAQCLKNSGDQLEKGLIPVAKSSDNSNNTSIKESVEEPKESNTFLKLADNVPEIPLLNEPTVQPATKDVVSEIDILQALKNEILSETIALPCAEVATPALHQPKITKVSNAQELPKKRISIEKYKQKSVTPRNASLFVTHGSVYMSNEESRKQSLKLTEKEVERFNLISKIALGDSSDDEENLETIRSPEDVDLAPQSPDVGLLDDASVSPPVIIPVDPVKTTVVSSKVDVDMRKISDATSVNMGPISCAQNNLDSKNINTEHNKPGKIEAKRPSLSVDPRVRRDKEPLLPTPKTFPKVTSSRTLSMNLGLTQSMAPNMTPNRTPTRAPNMTPNARSFEVTPSRSFDTDDISRKHVYAPMYSNQDNNTIPRTPVWEPSEPSPMHKPSWDVPDREKNLGRKWDDRDPRNSFPHRDEGTRPRFGDSYDGSYNRSRNDRYGRDDFSRQDGPQTPSFYGRGDCPATPTPSFGRGDAPATPSHYFGRSEGSMTPIHPFGRTESSLTPTQLFGKTDAPLTPSHPFGRSEAPSTPSHPFGRSEAPLTPSHPFGRSDYSYKNPSSNYGKLQDPRFNRNNDNDSHTRSDHGSYNDRYRYNRNDPRTFNNEKSLARNTDKGYTHDQSYNRDNMSRREPSVGRLTPKDNERDRLYSGDRNYGLENSRSYAEVGSRRNLQREPSAGRSIPDPRSRASSVGRSNRKDTSNELSVKSHAGRAFTIDTSVNSTFQKFIDSHRTNDINFDTRRQRASSVGRSLIRESSSGRTLSSSSSQNTEKHNMYTFRRAQSVGRDLSRAQSVGRDLKRTTSTEKSFKDVKAEFESFRNKSNIFKHENTLPPTKTHGFINNRDPRCRRESYDKSNERTSSNKSNLKETNVPVKKINYRDPRQRKEQKIKERSFHKDHRNRLDSRDRHSYGISSESITKNLVINSVKNYKIPKIKRAPAEKPVVDVATVKDDSKKKEVKQVKKDAKQKSIEEQTKINKKLKSEKKQSAEKSVNKDVRDEKAEVAVEVSDKRVTRQSGRSNEITQSSEQSDDEDIVFKPRKFKKVICQSDSDENSSEIVKTSQERKYKQISPKKPSLGKNKNLPVLNKTNENENLTEDQILPKNKPNEPIKDKELEANLDTFEPEEKHDSSFGLDEIENLFPDNIITDPVMDNINALIADLDHDLETPKGDATCNDLFSEINIENMLNKITSSPVKPCKDVTESPLPNADVIRNNLFDSLKQSEYSCLTALNKSVTIADNEKTDVEKTQNTESPSKVKNNDSIGEQKDLLNILLSETVNQTDKKNDAEPVVSTSVSEEETPKKDLSLDSGKTVDGRSTPDSTNDAEVVTKDICRETERLPDSTIEKQCEMNSDISSTHNADEKACKDSPEVPKEKTSQIDSIGNLLSILQDKSKIKELLSMLGDQSSDNEKIKKKLEKLSEIVSDDEDTNDGRIEESRTLHDNKVEIKDVPQDAKQETVSENRFNEEGQNDHKVDSPTKCEDKVQGADILDDKSDQCVMAQELVSQPEEQKDVDDEATSELDNDQEPSYSVKKNVKKVTKRFKSGKFRRGRAVKRFFDEGKRVTRSEGSVLLMKPGPAKKPSRELKQLQESIKEMFMSDDILNASGIRMCRLAKMVDDKTSQQKDNVLINESEPVVVLEKVKHMNEKDGNVLEKPPRKKPGPKPKVKPALNSPDENKLEVLKPNQVKYKPGPKSKTRIAHTEKDTDPYNFETDSLNDTKESEKALDNSSDSESDSLASSKSFGSSELLVELKKKPKRKRGRGGWQAGVIKPKNKKRKVEVKRTESREPSPEPEQKIVIPDFNCFTDKKYCFSKNVSQYSCRLCESTHSGADIVFHYKKHHPHSEIPLSRMSLETAKEAIEQCEEINFQAISKIPTEKYTCRFCYKEFARKRASLESFFWHVVSMHTGEYKQLCSECINVTRCPFNLDIPPPPKDIKGQLIGYICGKCNFTQISLENLKMHVIVRHNDEQTEVYTINFAVMTKKTINSLVKRCGVENQPRVTRSSRSIQSLTEVSDDRSDVTESEPEMVRAEKKSNMPAASAKPQSYSFKSKITFETDDNVSDISNAAESSAVKVEGDDEDDNQQDTQFDEPFNDPPDTNDDGNESALISDKNQRASDDIMDYPHFKIRFTETGNKEYVCCINGTDNHYKTGLLISMKKHVQLKHSESWDGYCFVCKVIVTPQGQHKFSDCLLHFLDNHMDNFPVLEKVTEPQTELVIQPAEAPKPPETASMPKGGYINVRPLAELLVNTIEIPVETPVALPVIENVVSLMTPIEPTVEPPSPSPTYPVIRKESESPKAYKYEEAQADIMSKKHRVVLDAMMAPNKLVQVFKCAGRFCSFTSDSAEDALVHASAHQRVGGTNALLCAYCDFDSSGNSIDLVSHVFKNHGRCQYVCGLCFYRAAANQLVGAHMARVHGAVPGQGSVLKAANALPLSDPTEGNLSRETAVPLYICNQSDREEACQFKTVTYAKFRDHLAQKHAAATSVTCYICSTTHEDATALVIHMMTHGLKLYHCTRCVFGADNEHDLLAHASARHPAKPPQAYLRTIRAMGDKGLKILPLVELKKTVLPTEEVAPNKARENPVREAERSIELEKLIGHINVLDAPADTSAEEPEAEDSAAVTELSQNLMNNLNETVSNIVENTDLAPMATLMPVPPLVSITIEKPARLTTPPPAEDQNLSKQLTPVLKEEPKDTTPEKTISDVICLDSDEDDSKQGIIDLSDDESAKNISSEMVQLLTQAKKVPSELLYKCAKCNMVCTTFHGFKKHLLSCYNKTSVFNCAHCSYTTDNINSHLTHYNQDHGTSGRYKCAVCHRSESFLSVIKKHVKSHNINKLVVTSQSGEFGDIQYIVGGVQEAAAPKPSKPARRKPSTGSAGAGARRRYGPADIDKLPINPILDESLQCEICEFSSKVRLNLVRHLQMHAEQQPVPETAPVNPVPHLESNEKHFDKMVNLASSSIVTRAPEKSVREPTPMARIPAETASRYPKYVPERHRHTCGARACAYISVDEGMLRRHWDALHAGCTEYHCVHCPPHQHLDKSKPLTASRIIAHLKMHDAQLYACSGCQYYHYKRQVLEKHAGEAHAGAARVLVVREEPVPPPLAAPTMDLKPWQCGLCNYKSMLRPEVADHCSKFHQSKMQFKCAYCPFRTSASENVTKHQASSHPNREQEIFYFYYREGSIPNAADGTPHWQKQKQRAGVDSGPEVKAEVSDASMQAQQHTGSILPQIQPPSALNLNLVKQEVDQDTVLTTIEELCHNFGEFCEPNGLNYRCSLCKVVMEESKVAMQSHLFEELKYRKWGCRLCSYKAFHQTGLKEHMWTEHRQNQEPIELAVDVNVEAWVSKQLDYQEGLIKKNREKLAQQRIQVERPVAPSTSKTVEASNTAASNIPMQELEKYFGPLGTSTNMMFCCPKCQFKTKDEVTMQDHLELELSKIRWCCSKCPVHLTTYHEAQFHCKSAHSGQAARPVEAARDPAVRAAWVAAALQVQRRGARCVPPPAHQPASIDTNQQNSNDSEENSLLVIRYEENVPIPEEETLRRKRPASTAPNSDDENLIIDEPAPKKPTTRKECPHCEFKTKYPKIIGPHILRHYNLKPFSCPYCEFNGNKPAVLQHISTQHSDRPIYANRTPKPSGPPLILDLSKPPKKFIVPMKKVADDTQVCLTCEKTFTEFESKSHVHDNIVPKFAKKGEVVVKCCECLLLLPDVVAMQQHNTDLHPTSPINYAYYKLHHDTRDLQVCFHCNQRFSHLIDLKTHHNIVHSSLKLKYSSVPYMPSLTENTSAFKRKADDTTMSLPKRCARKSTTKLPNSQAVAKKSTTKLPFYVDSDSESEEEEYSYYGTQPTSWDDLTNVTTLMPFCNTILPFTLKKLNEFININPKVVVKDIKK